MSGIKQLLGETVIGKGSKPVSVDSFSGPGKVVGLYFSAHWCGPCRSFTPTLVKFYDDLKLQPNKPLEIVFLSSDQDEGAFKDYYAEMPWLAIPKGDDRKEKLSKKYKVRGIPTLIFLDGETGEVITKDGRSIVTSDPTGNNYPWPTPTFAGVMTGCKLTNRKQEEVDAMEALEGKVRGLYFSAHWCPPCRQFTPKLVETYNKIREDGKKFEIIFVSSDKEETAYKEYLDTMPWPALKFKAEQAKKLDLMFEINGIPMLILLDENNKVISQNARRAVSDDPTGKDFPWLPQPLNKLTGEAFDVINDELCFLLVGGAEEKEEDMKDAMKSSAEKYADKEDGPKFFYGFSDDEEGVVESLFDYLGVKDPTYPLLLTINIPEKWTNLQAGISLSEDTIKGILAKHEEGQLEHTPMKA